jgi:D-psicose/D-tagatose/L-ribulose 3-epimerase
MKLGINTWIWTSPLTTDEFPALAEHIATMGFDLVEVPIERPGDLDYTRAGAIARDQGLAVTVCAAMSPDRDLIHPDESIRDNGMAYVRHCIEAAYSMGATRVGGPLYSAVGRTWQATADERAAYTDLLVSQLQSLSQHAADHGVVLGVEPLNRFETSVLNLTSDAIAIVDRVGHPACGLMLDTFHMNIEETSIGDAIRAAGPRLRHLHACENDRGAPGSGHVPWGEVAQALRDIDYDEGVVIESFTSKVKTIARAAAIWRPLAASQDALAENGLRHLRALFGQGS